MLIEVVLTGDPFDGSHPRTQAPPLVKPPVLTGAHQILTSSVMRMLVEDPVSSHHVAGVDVGGMEVLKQGGDVFRQLHHLAAKLGPFVQHHLVSSFGLRKNKKALFGKYKALKLQLKKKKDYHGDHTAGPHAVVETHPALVVRIFPLPQEVLVAHVVGFLIDDPVPAVHPDGVAAAEVGVQV